MDKIEVDYEELQKIAKQFQRILAKHQADRKKLKSMIEELETGGWLGRGSDKFYQEMYGEVLPSLNRLEATLDKISDVLVWVMRIMRDGEQNAANLFKGGGLANLIANMKHTAIGLPDFPPPPAQPSSGDGSGAHGSNPSGLGDRANALLFQRISDVAETLGLDDAARHMRHYLNNTGDTLLIRPEELMRDMPQFQNRVDYTFKNDLIHQINDRIANEYQGQPMSFKHTTQWLPFYAGQSQYPNWFFAMGGFSYAHGAEVTVTPDPNGGSPIVNVRHQLHVFDRYNWDENKSVTIGPLTITDEALGALHEAGLAKEYEIRGTSSIQETSYQYNSEFNHPSQLNTLDDRTGTREDTNRERGPRKVI